MDGLINFHKPVGLSSSRALYQVRDITGVRKSGHAGTLDPEAEGVLVLCLGRGTKLVERLMDQPKVYRTEARLDLTSPGFDLERDVQEVSVAEPPSYEQVAAALAGFVGCIQQAPPTFSAVKLRGRPAYKLSRAGKPPVLAPRPVTIYWLHLWRYEWPVVDFELACGRGTYIRSLIRDLGVALGTGGCLTRLVRRAIGPFTLEHSWTFSQIAEHSPAEWLVDVATAPEMLAEVVVPPAPGAG